MHLYGLLCGPTGWVAFSGYLPETAIRSFGKILFWIEQEGEYTVIKRNKTFRPASSLNPPLPPTEVLPYFSRFGLKTGINHSNSILTNLMLAGVYVHAIFRYKRKPLTDLDLELREAWPSRGLCVYTQKKFRRGGVGINTFLLKKEGNFVLETMFSVKYY